MAARETVFKQDSRIGRVSEPSKRSAAWKATTKHGVQTGHTGEASRPTKVALEQPSKESQFRLNSGLHRKHDSLLSSVGTPTGMMTMNPGLPLWMQSDARRAVGLRCPSAMLGAKARAESSRGQRKGLSLASLRKSHNTHRPDTV